MQHSSSGLCSVLQRQSTAPMMLSENYKFWCLIASKGLTWRQMPLESTGAFSFIEVAEFVI